MDHLRHSHTFGQDRKQPGEVRTLIVIVITATMMVVEISAGIVFGSVALLADGLHMASHTVALSINAFAYIYARRRANDTKYSFGTGKVNSLGGFTGAILLAMFALMMVWESMDRFIHPVEIAFNQAIFVAILGLIVNGVSVFILDHHDHGHDHHNNHGHDHHHTHDHHHRDHDHNLRAAYLHVLADALTSLLAIFALLAAKYAGLIWMDPMMGIVGAILVARWSVGLLRSTSAVLLDEQASDDIQNKVREVIEDERTKVTDLHIWSIGPNIFSAIISICAENPYQPEQYKDKLPSSLGIVHATVEVHKTSLE